MGIHVISDPTGEPVNWKVTHFANVSGSEKFLMQLAMEMPMLVDAAMIYEPEREKLKEAVLAISIEGLMPAFEDLKKIRALPMQKIPELSRRQLYEDFTVVLWRAYRT